MGRFLRGEMNERPPVPENYFDRATEGLLAELKGQEESELARYSEVVDGALPVQAWRKNAVRLFANWLTLVAAAKARKVASPAVPTRRRAS